MVLIATNAQAQLVTDPQRVEFTPSADHDALDTSGVPLVQSYTLSIYQSGGSQLVQTVALGKPTPQTDGMIRVNFVALLSPPLTGGVTYEGRVSANGPGGSSTSLPSNTFSFSLPCAPTISPSSQTVSAGGGTGTVNVTAGAGCAWTAASNASWITITAGALGTGNGAVSISTAANGTTSARSGTLTIGGRTFTVNQTALSCSPSISPASQSVSAGGGSGTVTVTVSADCAWTATESSGWITITSGASGTGNGSTGFTASANTGTSARSATLTIGGQTVTVNQAGGTGCTFVVTPAALNLPVSSRSGSLTITTSAGCSWTTSSPVSWLTLAGGGSTSGSATYFALGNTGNPTRTTTVTIAGHQIVVTQVGTVVSPARRLRVVGQ